MTVVRPLTGSHQAGFLANFDSKSQKSPLNLTASSTVTTTHDMESDRSPQRVPSGDDIALQLYGPCLRQQSKYHDLT
jgi:hypothetical protein